VNELGILSDIPVDQQDGFCQDYVREFRELFNSRVPKDTAGGGLWEIVRLLTRMVEEEYDISLMGNNKLSLSLVQQVLDDVTKVVSSEPVPSLVEEVTGFYELIMRIECYEWSKEMELRKKAGDMITLLAENIENDRIPKAEELLPDKKGIRHFWAVGILSRNQSAWDALKDHRRKQANIAVAGERKPDNSYNAETIGDVILDLMSMFNTEGPAPDIVRQLLKELGKLPSGTEELKRVQRDAPTHWCGHFDS